MEERDIPIAAQGVEKLHQGARSFRELETVKTLVGLAGGTAIAAPRGAAPHHVADMKGRHFIIREVECFQSSPFEKANDPRPFLAVSGLDSHAVEILKSFFLIP